MAEMFVFVAADQSGKSGVANRQLIRSQCMQGKNRRIGSRRTRKEFRRSHPVTKWIIYEGDQSGEVLPSDRNCATSNGHAEVALVTPPASPLEHGLVPERVPRGLGSQCAEVLHCCKLHQPLLI